MTEELKFCKDCKYHFKIVDLGIDISRCLHPRPTNRILSEDGIKSYNTCSDQRNGKQTWNDRCGPSGHYFEPKPVEPIKAPSTLWERIKSWFQK